jgi:epoxyqueuosine reductase
VIASEIRRAALDLGFARVGFTPVEPLLRGGAALRDWLAASRHGEMSYLEGERHDPAALCEGARTVIVVALPYARESALPIVDARPRGVIARYARGADYHLVLLEKLRALAAAVSTIVGRPLLWRACIDSAPLLEREAAHASGVGFIAKSTMAIVPGVGTYVLLGELLVDVDITADAPAESRCGSCTSCLDACPTGAFVDAFVLDARRCISYLTIELKGVIPRDLRPLIGTRIFGCDVCQEVCPFNASSKPRPAAPELAAFPHLHLPLLEDLLHIRSKEHRRFVPGTALRRVNRQQLMRNAAVAMGNCGDASVVPALHRALVENPSAMVRVHVAWALGRYDTEEARQALRRAQDEDDAPEVRQEAIWCNQ